MTNIKGLLLWQEIELEGTAIQRSLVELKKRQEESPALRAARMAVETADQRVRDGKKAQEKLEYDLDSVNGKRAASQNRLYGGKVKNPKELQGLEDEVEYLGERADQIQEEILEVLLEVEEGEETLGAATSSLSEIEGEWQAEQKIIAQEIEKLTARLTQLKADRAVLQRQISRDDLELYVDLRRRKGPSPIAHVIQGSCEGCGVSLSVTRRRQVKADEELVFCSSCGRLLTME